MNEQTNFDYFNSGLLVGVTIGILISAAIVFLALNSFSKNPVRTMKMIIRRGEDVELELNEMHQIFRKESDEKLEIRFKKHNHLIEVTTYKSKNLFRNI